MLFVEVFMTEYISRWLAEEVDFSNEDKVYDDIAKDVIEKTSEFNNESGTLEYKDFSEGLIAKSILAWAIFLFLSSNFFSI